MIRKNLFFVLLILIIGFQGLSQPITSVGTEFWVAFQPNSDGSSYILVINSDYSCSGNISSAYNSYSQDFMVIPGVASEITIPLYFCLGENCIGFNGAFKDPDKSVVCDDLGVGHRSYGCRTFSCDVKQG